MNYKFKNPENGYEESFDTKFAFWLTLLAGPFYFLVKEVWNHAAASLFLAIITGGISWLIYPFFAQKVLIKNYIKKGFIQVEPLPQSKEELEEQKEKIEQQLKKKS